LFSFLEFVTQEILSNRQLQRISDLSGCHRHKRRVNCTQRCLNYRTFDGTCNNFENTRLGAANTPLQRLLAAEYENGFSTPKGWNKSHLQNGFSLPNPRQVSSGNNSYSYLKILVLEIVFHSFLFH
jgi:peroxidase